MQSKYDRSSVVDQLMEINRVLVIQLQYLYFQNCRFNQMNLMNSCNFSECGTANTPITTLLERNIKSYLLVINFVATYVEIKGTRYSKVIYKKTQNPDFDENLRITLNVSWVLKMTLIHSYRIEVFWILKLFQFIRPQATKIGCAINQCGSKKSTPFTLYCVLNTK